MVREKRRDRRSERETGVGGRGTVGRERERDRETERERERERDGEIVIKTYWFFALESKSILTSTIAQV